MNPNNSKIERKSYTQRRELFKDIWNTKILLDEDGDVAAVDEKLKPKVIKTLRLDKSSTEKASIRKKRLKSLRTVCNKILAFCDKQEEEELYYDQIISRDKKKTLKHKHKKNVKKSYSSSKGNALAEEVDTERKYRIKGDGQTVPLDRKKKLVKRVKTSIPMVASQITSKLTSTRSPLRNIRSPTPVQNQNVVLKKCSTKKKKSTHG